jgi:hypothetical protein
MSILQNLFSAFSISPWSTPQKSLQELSSLSAFAQEICPKLIHEIQALPKEHGTGRVRGLLLMNLVDFQTNLSKLGNALNDVDTDRTRRALDNLERLCQVSLPFLLFCFVPNLELGNFILERKPNSNLVDSKCIIVAESILPDLRGRQQLQPGQVSLPQ